MSTIRNDRFRGSGGVDFLKVDVEGGIPARFEKIVQLFPQRIAIQTRDRSVSYQALDEAANRLACEILERLGFESEPVALLLDDDIEVIIAIIGVLKAGKIYVPIDPSHPSERNKRILADINPRLIITDTKTSSLLGELTATTMRSIHIDRLHGPRIMPQVSMTGETIAYILYTSGSTAMPKGVFQNHRSLLHLVMRHTQRALVSADDRIALLRSFAVHGGTLLAFVALLNGATLLPFDIKRRGLFELAYWLGDQKITITRMGPSLLRQLLAILNDKIQFSTLRELSFSGEPLYWSDIEKCRKHLVDSCVLVNSFGATEASSCCEFVMTKDTPIGQGVVPCGVATSDMTIVLLKDQRTEVSFGSVGEIAIDSRYLALGYWSDPGLTAQRFLSSWSGGDNRIYLSGDHGRFLPDGSLLFVGRERFQVKIRGYRIDLGEIEAALAAADNVKDAIVVARQDSDMEMALLAYVVPQKFPAPSISTIRRSVATVLPDFMVPSDFVVLAEMPLTVNGKVDRNALPPPSTARPNLDVPYEGPRNSVEQRIAAIWAEVLGKDQIGVHDDFLELGGHSLKATQVMSRLRVQFGNRTELSHLFEYPTIAQLAAVITRDESNSKTFNRVLSEIEALSEERAQSLLAQRSRT